MLQTALEGLFKNFEKSIENNNPMQAIDNLSVLDEGMELRRTKKSTIRQLTERAKSAEELIPLIAIHYNLTYTDAQNLVQACDKMLNDYCKNNPNLPIEEKRRILEFARNTNLETPIKSKLCMDVAIDAIRSQDKDALEVACLKSDGMSLNDFNNNIKGAIEVSEFLGGRDEANLIECIILTKDSPSNAVQEFTIKLNSGDITLDDYAKILADLEKYLPESHEMTKDEIHNAMAREIVASILEENETSMDFEIKLKNGEVVIDGKGDGYELQFVPNDFEDKQDERNFIDEYTNGHPIYDMINDMVSNPNLPPDSPEFVSELQQKIYGYLSKLQSLPKQEDLEQDFKATTNLFTEINQSSALVALDSAYSDRYSELENQELDNQEQDRINANREYEEEEEESLY